MKKIADVTVSVGINAKKEKLYRKVGTVFESDKGVTAIKLDVLPMPRTDKLGEPPCVWLKVVPIQEQPPATQHTDTQSEDGDGTTEGDYVPFSGQF